MLSVVLALLTIAGPAPSQPAGRALAAMPQKMIPLQPKMPIGGSGDLSRTVDRIAQMTQKGDFAGARAALRLLPGSAVDIEWDDSAVPESSRFDFSNTRDGVLREWGNSVTTASFNVVKQKSSIRVAFDPAAEGSKLTWSEDAAKPRLTVLIGLKEGAKNVDPATVHNEFSFAIGSYLGIAKIPRAGFLMAATPTDTPRAIGLSQPEAGIANGNIAACDAIRSAVLKSVPVVAGLAALADEPKPVVLGPVLQGSKVPILFELKNSGSGEMAYQIMPDCTCFAREKGVGHIAPGASGKTLVSMDTTEFAGLVRKTLYLFTNDPSNPVRAIPVEITITPRYRMLPPAKIYVVEDNSLTVEAFLFAPADHPLAITAADTSGLPGEVAVQPWEGTMADPDRGEGPMPRKGYKITFRITGIPSGGQFGASVILTTDDVNFPRINYPVFVQKGILAQPSSVFMGEVGAATRTMYFTLSRPGQPFKITDISADSTHIAVTPTLTNSGDYQISVAYDGKADKGDYHATITIKTDDPKQPLIEVPVTATIK